MTPLKLALSLLPAVAAIGYASVANSYELYILATVGFYTMVGVGLNILLGLTGQVSLGHVGFYAIGAYAVAILTTDVGLGFWPSLIFAIALTGVVGILLSIPALRVSGPYLAMITIAFAFIIEHGAVEWRELTGGANGMMNIPPVSLFGFEFSELATIYLVIVMTALTLFLYWRFADGTWGLAMRAVRDSEVAGQSLGLNPVMIRAAAFGLSAMAAGLAGGLFSPIIAFVSPSSFSFFQSILFLLVVIIGGSGTVFGPLVGALIVGLLPEFLSDFAEYRLLFFGGLLLVVMWLAPAGIVGALTSWLGRGDTRIPDRDRENDVDVDAFLSREARADQLNVADLAISFGGVRAVESLDFTAKAGKITSIIGPNGAGKTTVLNVIGGFYKPDRGTVRMGDVDLAGKPSHVVSRAGVSRTYQTTELFGDLTVLENLLVALGQGRLGGFKSALTHMQSDAQACSQCEALLDFVGFKGDPGVLAKHLAHVDKRLVEIARALATRPDMLLLDEPAAGLSAQDTELLIPLLRKIAAAGVIVILVEHDMGLVMEVSDHIIVLDAGAPIAAGRPAAIRKNKKVREAYLGTGEVIDRARQTAIPEADRPVLDISQLVAGYGAAPVLQDIDLKVGEGEFVTVLGANGAGKSTLMRALSGLHRPVEGRILFIGDDITSWNAYRVARRGLVLVPEGRQVFPELGVDDNIRLGAYARDDFDDAAELEEMLDRFPALRQRRTSRAGLLSGGEQQMLAIARGLVARPDVIMLDEPSLGLAPALIEDLFSVLAELRDEERTILLVDQMAALALSVADRGYVLESGRVVHQGSAKDLKKDKSVEQAYLGGGR
ncbi:MAG: branched-chain amino acid ABC transporter ATP-binding protein/permease [Hyphomicrobiaceae bacterium]|nr:branched-chain amino acid ABC transporter ATP-binding protein/permease [Hyphomicrobiaceae bacterium]